MQALALENFVEMRYRVAYPRFLLRKKVELALEATYPQLFVPKYAMVTFHRIPYSVALARGVVQDRILAELCDPIGRVEDLDWTKADQLIRSQLSPLEQASCPAFRLKRLKSSPARWTLATRSHPTGVPS